MPVPVDVTSIFMMNWLVRKRLSHLLMSCRCYVWNVSYSADVFLSRAVPETSEPRVFRRTDGCNMLPSKSRLNRTSGM
jgi:hypothetical protein